MAASASSSAHAARQAIADRLKEIRTEAGLKATELAARAGWDRTKVSQIEHGRRAASVDDVRAWCRICGATGESAELEASVRAAKGMWVEWRRMERTGLRHAQQAVAPVYDRTVRFRAYSSWLLPGILQTEAYTRAVLRAVQRRRRVIDDVDAAVEIRMRRQQVLRRPGKTFAFLLEEPLLRCGVGGAQVQAEQLRHLRDLARWPSVSLGIVPVSPARSLRPVEDFWIFDDREVNVELVSGYLTLTTRREVAMYEQVFGVLTGSAVYGSDAGVLIERAEDALT